MLAERAGLRIHEVPVDWIDDPDSRVAIIPTALADLRGIARLGIALARSTITVPVLRGPAPPGPRPGGTPGRYGQLASQLARFIVVGVVSTVAYVLLYLLLRGGTGGAGRERPQPADHRGGQYSGQPAADLRHPRPRPRRAPPAARPDRVRHRPRGHLRRAGGAARRHRPAQLAGRGLGAGAFGGGTGITRMFTAEWGGQISWLIPAALIAIVVMLWVSRRAARTGHTRAAAIMWGGWLVVAGPVSLAVIAGLAGPLACSLDTAATSYAGTSPSAGRLQPDRPGRERVTNGGSAALG